MHELKVESAIGHVRNVEYVPLIGFGLEGVLGHLFMIPGDRRD